MVPKVYKVLQVHKVIKGLKAYKVLLEAAEPP
jgi:hypothetical protein